MRKITREACEVFYSRGDMTKANMCVVTESEGTTTMYLHNNAIARLSASGDKLEITLAGWNTNTTRERLNGLKGVRVSTKQGQAYLNGEKWDGEWITIKRA